MQVGCGNRPDHHEKRKIKEDFHESASNESAISDVSSNHATSALCKKCRINANIETANEESFFNSECNVNRNPRFINGKVRSYGIIYTIYNCGIIVDYLEINLSEQVHITLLHWMNMLKKIDQLSTIPTVFVYDNACSVWMYFKKRFHETKTIAVTEVSSFIDAADLYIDRLHQKTHSRPMCQTDRNIKHRTDLDNVNTVVCEQTNSWLKQYLNILCNFSGQRSKFYYLFLFHHWNCKRSLQP